MRKTLAPAALACALVAAAAGALRAQTMPGDAHAPVDPARALDDALGNVRPVQRQVVHYAGRNAHNWVVPLRTARGQCYELLGIAVGSARVSAEVFLRHARVGDPVSLASSRGDVSRARFCASMPGPLYSLILRADGPTQWAYATREVGPDEPPPDPDAAHRERLLTALATNAAGAGDGGSGDASATATTGDAGAPVAAVSYPVGGTEQDYPGNQLRSLASGLPGALPVVASVRAQLGTNQSREVPIALRGGQCVVVAAAGVPSVADLDIEIADPAAHRVAQDAQHRGVESVRYCAPYTGTYRATVRVFAGGGLVGIQAFEVQ